MTVSDLEPRLAEPDDPRLEPPNWRDSDRMAFGAEATQASHPTQYRHGRSGTSSGCCAPAGWAIPVLYGLLIAAELFNLVQAAGFWWTTLHGRDRDPAPRWLGPSPRVDVLIPVYNEPLDVVAPSVFAAVNLRGARVRVHLLDDAGRDDLAELARRAGASYQRRPGNDGAKAGNLNHALRRTDAPFVVVFDCDHVPDERFLEHTLGFMDRRRRRLCPDAPVLRQRGPGHTGRRRLVATGPLLRRHRSRQGRPRRHVLLRHQRRVPARRVGERRRLSRGVADRGLRALGGAPRTGLAFHLRQRGLGPGPRSRGHGVVREPAATLGPRLPVRSAAADQGGVALARASAVPPLLHVLPVRVDLRPLHGPPGHPHLLRRPAPGRCDGRSVPRPLRAVLLPEPGRGGCGRAEASTPSMRLRS